jgi:hypothetical protein
MTPIEILHHDHVKNHTDSQHFLISVDEILDRVITGYKLAKFDKTMIIHREQGSMGEGMEFHCYNAGTGDELAVAVVTFLDQLREQGLSWAWTPYQNSKINMLLEKYIPTERLTVVKTETGYEATVRL